MANHKIYVVPSSQPVLLQQNPMLISVSILIETC